MATNLISNTKIARVENAASAGTSTLTSDVVDVKHFDGCTFIALLGDVTDTAALELVVQHGDAADGSDAADTTTSAAFTAGASDADNKLLAVEIIRPVKRYVRAKLVRGTANAVVDGIVAVVTDPHSVPTTADATVIGSAVGASPASA